MQRMKSTIAKARARTWYRGADVPRAAILRFARRLAEQFRPDKIVLFGSHACGSPHADSDVDVLVVMPARNQLDQALQIELACDPPFPLDLIVRTPLRMQADLAAGDSFVREIMEKGQVLYEKGDEAVDSQGRSRFRRGHGAKSPKRAPA